MPDSVSPEIPDLAAWDELNFDCETCGAAPGERCKTSGGNTAGWHTSRVERGTRVWLREHNAGASPVEPTPAEHPSAGADNIPALLARLASREAELARATLLLRDAQSYGLDYALQGEIISFLASLSPESLQEPE